MTQVPATVTPGGEIAQYQNTGLEDMTPTDAVIPRLKIVGKEGVWEDNLTHTKIPALYFIALGLVKQRVLFHPNVQDNDVPMCKSSNYNDGYPNPEAPTAKSFPWQISGFDPSTIAPIDAEGKQRVLPCAACQLKEWGSHPAADTPYCAEQWTMPIYFDNSGQPGCFDQNVAWDSALAEWTPAILTLQKSSLKPIKSYLSSFKAGNKPPFLSICRGTLTMKQRGDVVYSVPNFTKGPESPRERWNEFAQSYMEMRTYLVRPPTREDEPDVEPQPPVDNSWGQPHAAHPPQQPAQQPQTVQGEVVSPVQQQPPAQDPWAQPAAAAQDPWTAAPVPQVDPWAQPQPEVQQVPQPQATPPVQQQPVAQPPVQQPPVQQPPVQQPPVQQPPVQQPPVQQAPPPVQQQPVAQPPVQAAPPPAQPQPQAPAAEPEQQPTPGPAGTKLPF